MVSLTHRFRSRLVHINQYTLYSSSSPSFFRDVHLHHWTVNILRTDNVLRTDEACTMWSPIASAFHRNFRTRHYLPLGAIARAPRFPDSLWAKHGSWNPPRAALLLPPPHPCLEENGRFRSCLASVWRTETRRFHWRHQYLWPGTAEIASEGPGAEKRYSSAELSIPGMDSWP